MYNIEAVKKYIDKYFTKKEDYISLIKDEIKNQNDNIFYQMYTYLFINIIDDKIIRKLENYKNKIKNKFIIINNSQTSKYYFDNIKVYKYYILLIQELINNDVINKFQTDSILDNVKEVQSKKIELSNIIEEQEFNGYLQYTFDKDVKITNFYKDNSDAFEKEQQEIDNNNNDKMNEQIENGRENKKLKKNKRVDKFDEIASKYKKKEKDIKEKYIQEKIKRTEILKTYFSEKINILKKKDVYTVKDMDDVQYFLQKNIKGLPDFNYIKDNNTIYEIMFNILKHLNNVLSKGMIYKYTSKDYLYKYEIRIEFYPTDSLFKKIVLIKKGGRYIIDYAIFNIQSSFPKNNLNFVVLKYKSTIVQNYYIQVKPIYDSIEYDFIDLNIIKLSNTPLKPI